MSFGAGILLDVERFLALCLSVQLLETPSDNGQHDLLSVCLHHRLRSVLIAVTKTVHNPGNDAKCCLYCYKMFWTVTVIHHQTLSLVLWKCLPSNFQEVPQLLAHCATCMFGCRISTEYWIICSMVEDKDQRTDNREITNLLVVIR